jgi:4-oxalocrotonate tautomerase
LTPPGRKRTLSGRKLINKEEIMPTITIALDQTSEEKKKQLVKNLTREAAEITGYPAEYFFVYIQEYPTENIGVGGKTVKELKSQ